VVEEEGHRSGRYRPGGRPRTALDWKGAEAEIYAMRIWKALTTKQVASADSSAAPAKTIGVRVVRTLVMPNGERLKVMREDAFRAALLATREAAKSAP